MEAAELGLLMLCICVFGTLIYSSPSPLQLLSLSPTGKAALMGVAIAMVTFFIIRSPFGRRSGAHFNPAITVAYFWLGRIHRWDAVYYVAFQFIGAVAGVFIGRQALGLRLAAQPVRYVVTLPGNYGSLIAFVGEFLLSGFLMGVVLFATNDRFLARFSPFIVAAVTVFYYAFGPSVSGFSVNPARTFSSAVFARLWQGVWIYFVAPCLGTVTAAAIYARSMGPNHVYCAKVFHDLESSCPFPCRFDRLHSAAPQGSRRHL